MWKPQWHYKLLAPPNVLQTSLIWACDKGSSDNIIMKGLINNVSAGVDVGL